MSAIPGLGEISRLEQRERLEDRVIPEPLADNEQIPEPRPWPDALAPEAFYGIAGEIVAAIEPHTEADPVALLVHVLVGYGSMIGRSAHYLVEATKHFTNEFVVLVGRSSKARKGTAEQRIRSLLGAIDEDWDREHVTSGLSSGEGLIWAVRDPIYKTERPRRTPGVQVTVSDSGVQVVLTDPGIDDKRLFVIEPEFASTLRVLGREGNTLSPILRRAWDEGNLRTLVKNAPAKATDAHVSVIGHITEDELRRHLDQTEAANGYGNRHLYLCVRRSRFLPFGGAAAAMTEALKVRLLNAVQYGKPQASFEWTTMPPGHRCASTRTSPRSEMGSSAP